MIIQSMLDNDLYKFTMMQAVLHQFPGAEVEYRFKCRTEGVDFRPYEDKIAREIYTMEKLPDLSHGELDYLGGLRFFKKDFIHFLKMFRFDPREYIWVVANNKGELNIHIKGPWLQTILFEVPILAIVSEVYSHEQKPNYSTAIDRMNEKIKLVQANAGWQQWPFLFAEFGTRRRHDLDWQIDLLQNLKANLPFNLVGTSNVLLAKEMDLTPIGTMAHEWIQAHQALYRVADSQFMAFENWAKEYRGDLGIALSDTIGLGSFLHDFDMYFSKLFDGTRQDSGSPVEYANQMIKHYESMKIDPTTKTIVFSDGLTMEIALNLWKVYAGKIRTSFGIGTHLTNDFNYKPLQIVLKMIKCNGQPVAKLSNSPGKTMCEDINYLAYLVETFKKRVESWSGKHG